MSGAVGVRLSEVPLGPFQERFRQMEAAVRDGWSGGIPKDAANTIAARLGWYVTGTTRHCGDLDGPRVRRTLGLRPYPGRSKNGRYYPPNLRKRITPSTALLLCEAMDMDPHEVPGL